MFIFASLCFLVQVLQLGRPESYNVSFLWAGIEEVIKWSGRHESKWHASSTRGSRFRTDSVFCVLGFILLLFFFAGKYHCPVLYSVFSNNSHIVANKVTGNVFSHEVSEAVTVRARPLSFSTHYIASALNTDILICGCKTNWCFVFYHQAVEQLNFKTKSLRDLLSDEPFTRKDIITIQVACCFTLYMFMFWRNIWCDTHTDLHFLFFRIQQSWTNSMFPTFFMSKITWKCWIQVSCLCIYKYCQCSSRPDFDSLCNL